MRKLKLFNYNKSAFLDLNSNKYLVDEMSGLGTGYKFVGEIGAIQDIEPEFENITLKINFGVQDNAYNCYKSLRKLSAKAMYRVVTNSLKAMFYICMICF